LRKAPCSPTSRRRMSWSTRCIASSS
jgi:hypothetical protein